MEKFTLDELAAKWFSDTAGFATQPAVNRMRWQQLRPKFADFAANAHGIIRADKSGNAVLEEIHAHQ